MKKDISLVMFSGGRDSLYAVTQETIINGRKCFLITFDNGSHHNPQLEDSAAYRLEKAFGKEYIEFLGYTCMYPLFEKCLSPFNYGETLRRKEYEYLLPYQVTCLSCHSAMYASSIIIAKKLGIKRMVTGDRESQLFFIEQKAMVDQYQDLASKNGITIENPVWNITSDEKIEERLARGIYQLIGRLPQECMCTLGIPMKEKLSKEEEKALLLYYKEYMLSSLCEEIENRVNEPIHAYRRGVWK